MDILLGIIEQGMIYGFLGLGLYITFQILNFPDLTVDGSFALGGAISAFTIQMGINPFIAVFLSAFGGLASGILTGIINVKLGISELLSGLIMQTGLYTLNLVIAGSSYVAIFSKPTLFSNSFVNNLENLSNVEKNLLILLPCIIVVKFLLDFYLKSKAGFLLKATGNNPILVTTMGKDPGIQKILGIAISNSLVASSGSMLVQQQRFFEITMGTGTMVMGLASIIIGIKLFTSISQGFLKSTTMVIFGSIIYKSVVSIVIQMGISAYYMKLLTAIIFLLILVFSKKKRKRVLNYVNIK